MSEENNEIKASKKRKKLDTNVITAIAVSIISLCALFVSIYQTKILAEQQKLITAAEKAQLWPNITSDFGGFSSEGKYNLIYFNISNHGIGPAVVEEFKIFYHDKEVENWIELYKAISNSDEFLGNYASYFNSTPRIRQVIPAGEKIKLLELKNIGNYPKVKAFIDEISEGNKVEFQLIYSSVFNDRWIVRGKLNDDPTPELITIK